MRIGIDAHIILPKHKRYSPRIANYTEQLITNLLDADRKQEHTWVLFFDERMKDSPKLKKFKRPNVIIKHFPFIHYRQYLPVLYSHMLVSAFLRSAKLDVFHSPEGLIPFVYPGRIVTTFHYVPRGVGESNLFTRTFMLGARPAFAQLCKRASRIVVNQRGDKKILTERHKYPAECVVVMEEEDIERADWPKRVKRLMAVYEEVAKERKSRPRVEVKKTKAKKRSAVKRAKQKKREEKKKERGAQKTQRKKATAAKRRATKKPKKQKKSKKTSSRKTGRKKRTS